jgi:hypothetical protein
VPDRLWLNVAVQLKFYRRNRLLLVIGLLFLLLFAVSVALSLTFGSTTGRFEIVRSVVSQLSGFSLAFLGGLALFSISSHLRNRSLKMVLTKPCPPEVWLGSVYLSAILIAVALYAAIAGLSTLLCLAWKIPVQTGFFFVAAQGLLGSLVVLFYLGFLSTLMHPVMAVLVALLLNESTFYGLRFALLTAMRTTGGNLLLPVLEKATYLLYMVLPIFEPFAEKTEAVQSSLRATGADWRVLLEAAGYTLAAAGLFYCLSLLFLKRKNLM